MFTSFQRRPIAQQLMILTMAVLFAIFAILTLVVQRNADSAALTVAEHNLEHEARIMAGMLDSIFESVKDRGERQSQFFLKYVGGTPTLSPESSKVGAGEQGRGFAVVADEVRKLAERTALSTQEISTTVRAILEETSVAVKRMQVVSASMAGSVGLAREAGESLSLIDEHARQTVETVQSIADSTREQSAASQEIARLVESIAQMAEGSSSRAVNNTERAKNLQRLATELQAQLSRFTT